MDHFGVIFWGPSGVTLGSLRAHFGIVLSSFGFVFVSFWPHFEAFSGAFWALSAFWTSFVDPMTILGPCHAASTHQDLIILFWNPLQHTHRAAAVVNSAVAQPFPAIPSVAWPSRFDPKVVWRLLLSIESLRFVSYRVSYVRHCSCSCSILKNKHRKESQNRNRGMVARLLAAGFLLGL